MFSFRTKRSYQRHKEKKQQVSPEAHLRPGRPGGPSYLFVFSCFERCILSLARLADQVGPPPPALAVFSWLPLAVVCGLRLSTCGRAHRAARMLLLRCGSHPAHAQLPSAACPTLFSFRAEQRYTPAHQQLAARHAAARSSMPVVWQAERVAASQASCGCADAPAARSGCSITHLFEMAWPAGGRRAGRQGPVAAHIVCTASWRSPLH